MTIADVRKICKKLPGVTEDIKWEHHLCFNIGGKMFLITSPDEFPVSATFKVNPEEFEELAAREGFNPSAYLARYHWVRLDDINRMSKKQWEYYLKESYNLVASKLSKKLKKEFGILG